MVRTNTLVHTKGGVWIEWEGNHRSEIQILGQTGRWKKNGPRVIKA